jgi:AcrR family transcriptional regulator
VTIEYPGRGDPKRSMELLWGVGERSRRGPKPKLTAGQIARAAIELADAEGLAALSMRRVADRLGVTAMSLYTYVPGKAELLDLMLDTVYGEVGGEVGGEDDGTGGWRERLEGVARRSRALYQRHPWLLTVATSRPVLGPNVTAGYDSALRAVDGIGLTDIEMDLVVTVLADYVHGAVRGAVDAAQAEQRTGISDDEWWAEYAPLLEKVFDPDRYPTAARVGAAAGAEYGAASDPARAFEFGLQRLLDGIAVLVAARSTGEDDRRD